MSGDTLHVSVSTLNTLIKDDVNGKMPDYMSDALNRAKSGKCVTGNMVKVVKVVSIWTSETTQEYTFYIIKKEDCEKDETIEELRKLLLEKFGKRTFVQNVGDSNCYSRDGTDKAINFFGKKLKEDCCYFYGATGRINFSESTDILTCDANGSISVLSAMYPNAPIVGNLVSKHSINALRYWGCRVSCFVTNYILLCEDYDDIQNDEGCLFGSDVGMMAKLCDKIQVAEGGPQSLNEALHNITQKTNCQKSIFVITGLRPETTETNWSNGMSAAQFLIDLNENYNPIKGLIDFEITATLRTIFILLSKNNFDDFVLELRKLFGVDIDTTQLENFACNVMQQQYTTIHEKLCKVLYEIRKYLEVHHLISFNAPGWFDPTKADADTKRGQYESVLKLKESLTEDDILRIKRQIVVCSTKSGDPERKLYFSSSLIWDRWIMSHKV